MSNSKAIIPTSHLAHELMTSLSFIKISVGALDLIDEADIDQCKAFIDHLVEVYLNDRMEPWLKAIGKEMGKDDDIHQTNELALLAWTERYPEIRKRVITVLDDMDLAIEDIINRHVGVDTWVVWSIVDIGRDKMLVEGEDYRVTDWKRRMASGEWSHGDER